MAARPPEFGEQTDEILKEFDFNAGEVANLRQRKIVKLIRTDSHAAQASINRRCDIANQCSPRMHLSFAPHLRKKRHGDQQQSKRSGRDFALCRRMAPSQYNWQRCVRSGSRTWLMIPSRQHSLVVLRSYVFSLKAATCSCLRFQSRRAAEPIALSEAHYVSLALQQY